MSLKDVSRRKCTVDKKNDTFLHECGGPWPIYGVLASPADHGVMLWCEAAISWASRKQDCIALSSCEAEIVSLSEAAKDVVYFRRFIRGLLPNTSNEPTSLGTDNKGAIDSSYNPTSHDRMKHVARRHYFVRDMVEDFQVVVPYVNTHDNAADFFTKPLQPAKFYKFRAILMNENARPSAPS